MKKIFLCAVLIGAAMGLAAQEGKEPYAARKHIIVSPKPAAQTTAQDTPAKPAAQTTAQDTPAKPAAQTAAHDTPAKPAAETAAQDAPARAVALEVVPPLQSRGTENTPDTGQPSPLPTPDSPLPPPTAAGWKPFSAGLGIEVNNNHPDGAAFAGLLRLDWRIIPRLLAGARVGLSSNFGLSNTLEAAALLRFNVLFFGGGIGNKKNDARRNELFVQAGAGLSKLWRYEGSAQTLLYEGGAGVRIPALGKTLDDWHLEAGVRFGSPFLWGVNLSVGKSFGKEK